MKIILGIETSCDETSASIVKNEIIKSNIILSQLIHQEYGGVVPEIASRVHQKTLVSIVKQALHEADIELEEVDAVAVTNGPGLIGSLLVGVNFSKGLCLALNIPFLGVNHIEGHIWSPLIENKSVIFPYICLVVSGGHTQLIRVEGLGKYFMVGNTRDDAAGEAFDKVGKMLGLKYPAGAEIDRISMSGDPDFIKFPRALFKNDNLEFSFSGVKTAVSRYLQEHDFEFVQEHFADICASFQKSVIDVVVAKTIAAAKKNNVSSIAISGGVAANHLLREELKTKTKEMGCQFLSPSSQLCTDNAAMIAFVGYKWMINGRRDPMNLTADPTNSVISETMNN